MKVPKKLFKQLLALAEVTVRDVKEQGETCADLFEEFK